MLIRPFFYKFKKKKKKKGSWIVGKGKVRFKPQQYTKKDVITTGLSLKPQYLYFLYDILAYFVLIL